MELVELTELKEGLQSVISKIDRFCFYSKKQQFYYANIVILELCQDIPDIVDRLFRNMQEINGESPVFDLEGTVTVLQELQKAQENKDYVFITDIFELQLLPVFVAIEERVMSAFGVNIDEELLKKNIKSCEEMNPQLVYSLFSEDLIKECISPDSSISDTAMNQLVELVEQYISKGYLIEPGSSGYYTMAVRKDDYTYYFHTNGNVVSEAVSLAEEWLSQEKMEYIFYGLGLGYPYREMLFMDKNISIQVYETNRELLTLAFIFAPVWEMYHSNRFEIIYDPTGRKLRKSMFQLQEDRGGYVFYPALAGIQKDELREDLELYFIEESSVRTHSQSLNGNFKKNIRLKAGNCKELYSVFSGKEVIIVAAGPSLDKNIDLLKRRKEGMLILAVGTVLKKLLKAGIWPDYIIMTDAGESVYGQIQGVENCMVPLLFLSTVFSQVPQKYQGEKYIIFQSGFAPAEETAMKRQELLVESGGSVATTAFDLCLRLGVEKIIFVGLDLAYTGGLDHARETELQAEVVQETGVFVDAVDGGKIPTGKNLKIYLDWLENRIARRSEEEKSISIIDATEGGARKKGMKIMKLEEVIMEV